MSKTINLGAVTAYADAVAAGYTGTREQFAQDLANAATYAAESHANAEAASDAAETATAAASAASLDADAAHDDATTAHSDAEAALSFKAAAENAAGTATTKAGEAANSASQAATSASGAAGSATAASGSATAAAGSATDAAASETAAAGSATAAAGSASAAAQTLVDVNTAGATQVAAIAAKGAEVLESIPADYTTLSNDVDDLKSDLNVIYDDGQLLTITQQALIHPTGDGTVTVRNGGLTYTMVTPQANNFGFTFDSVIGKTYTASMSLKNIIMQANGMLVLFAVKGTTFSTSTYLAKSENIYEDGNYSITFTATTTTTTIWLFSNYLVTSFDAENILCTGGWGYNGLDTAFTQEKRPAQGKAVGLLADRVTAVEDSVDRIIQDNNLITINATTLQHTAGDATAVFDLPNGFVTNNSGNTNNIFGFIIPTQAKKTYRLKFNVVVGPIRSLYICKTEVYNTSNYIDKRENLVAEDSIDIEFSATSNVTSVWFYQQYDVASIAVSNIFVGDDRLRYNSYILDYTGTEITVFNKILCIGDSITEGTFNYESGGSTNNVIADRRYSYPAILAKLSGCEVVNYGHGGDTAQAWYARYQSEDLSGYDACIIMLGINDGVQNVGVDNFRTGMTNIINKVKNENSGIRIFVATIIPAYSDYDTKFDAYIAETKRLVEEDFPDTFLVDINKYSECKYYTYYAQGHLTAIGYQELAKEFYTLISYIIHNDLQAFRNVQFIGTNYTYPDFANT